MRGMAVLLVAILLCAPVASACETEAANALLGKFPSPTGISPDKDEVVYLAELAYSMHML